MNEKLNGRSRLRRRVGLGLVLSLIGLIFFPGLLRFVLPSQGGPKVVTAPTFTKSVDTGSYFFRLKARYSYGDEPINFDIVVGCSVQVTRYRGGDSGFLAARYPRFFVHRTRDGHAVMQIVPIACRGETTENGIVPKDFLPGAVWFEKYGDYRFGIAYVSEDAFESPNGKLKFHGASVHRATSDEWGVFRKRAAENEGMRKRYYDRPYYWTPEAQRIASSGGKEIESAYARGCTGVRRYKLSEAGRTMVRKHWPASRPRYWATHTRDDGPWPELQKLEQRVPIFENGFRYVQHLIGSGYNYGGFPTRARGGMFHSRSFRFVPPEIFPMRSDRGIPWVFRERVARSKYLSRDVEVRTGPGKGFLYCYTTLNPGEGKLEIPLPNYRDRISQVRVDGEAVVTPNPKHWSWSSPFFEEDEYIYFLGGIGLS